MGEKLHVKLRKVFKKAGNKAKPAARDLSIGVTGGIITNKMQDAWNKNKDNEDKEVTKMENEKTALEKLEEAAMEKEALALGTAVKGLTKGVSNGAKGLVGGVKNVAGKAKGFGNKVVGTNVKNAEKTLETQTKYFDNLNKNMKFPKGAGGEKLKANMNNAADKVLSGSQQRVTDAIGDTKKARKQLGLGVAGVAGAGIGANAIKNNMTSNDEEKTALEILEEAVMEKEALYDRLKTTKQERKDARDYAENVRKKDKTKFNELNGAYAKAYRKNRGGIKEIAKEMIPYAVGGIALSKGLDRSRAGLSGSGALTGVGIASSVAGYANSTAKNIMSQQKALVDAHKETAKDSTKEKTAFEELEDLVLSKQAEAEAETDEKVDETALNKAVEEVGSEYDKQLKDKKESDDKKEDKNKEKCAGSTEKCAEEDDEDKYHAFIPEKKEKDDNEDKKDDNKDDDDNEGSKKDKKAEKCASDDFDKPTFESDLIKTAQEMCEHREQDIDEKDPRSIDKKFDELFKNIRW